MDSKQSTLNKGEEPTNLTNEVLGGTGESLFCIFCGQHSRKKRKRQSCDTYEGVSSIKIPKTLRKLQRKMNSSAINILKVDHLECSKCLSKACVPCIRAISQNMKSNNDHKDDPWYQTVSELMEGTQQSPSFIGHCCELKTTINKNKYSTCHKRNNDVLDRSQLLYDGCLHIPAIAILIPPSMNCCVDVHGLGREGNIELPGLLHGVINKENAKVIYEKKLKPNGRNAHELPTVNKIVSCKNIDGDNITYKCLIQTFLINPDFDTTDKKHKVVTSDDIKSSMVLVQPPIDITWIILATTSLDSSNRQLVNIRFPSHLDPEKYTSTVSENLYKDTIKLLSNNGYDATRKGGSNGHTTYANAAILSLLKSNTAFPRKGKGVKIVRRKNLWVCYYLAAGGLGKSKHIEERKVTSWKYSQPQRGGQFALNLNYLTKYQDIICNMTKIKYNSSLLAVEIGNMFKFKVQEEAIFNAMADIDLCRNMLRQCGNGKKDIMVRLLAAQNHYTLVAYPVSYHYDVFRKGEHSLENKVCFKFDLAENQVDIGRGGGGADVFVFALLD